MGTRQDLAESLEFAAQGQVHAHFSIDSLDRVNAVFDRMKAGRIDGRVVLRL